MSPADLDALREGLGAEELAALQAEDPMHPPRPAPPPTPVRGSWYITECESCGWIGSSEHCGDGGGPDHDDIVCPVCCLSMAGDAPSEADTAKHGEAVYQRIVGAEADRDAALARATAAEAEIEGLRAALVLLLPFVDFAAGEGLEFRPDPDDATQDMDAADLCSAAARALGHELGDPDYVALLAAGHDAIRALAATTEALASADVSTQEGQTR